MVKYKYFSTLAVFHFCLASQTQAAFRSPGFLPSQPKCIRNDDDKLNTLHVFEACPQAPFSSLQQMSSELLDLSPFRAQRAFANHHYVNGKFMHTPPCAVIPSACWHTLCQTPQFFQSRPLFPNANFSGQILRTLIPIIKFRANRVELGASLVAFS